MELNAFNCNEHTCSLQVVNMYCDNMEILFTNTSHISFNIKFCIVLFTNKANVNVA